MRRRLLSKKVAAVGGVVCLALSVLISPVTTIPAQAAAPGNEEATPQREVIRWVFKEENGGLYRRLYNLTYNRWLTDWLYVGPL